MDSWYELKDAMLERRIPFDEVPDTHAFDYPRTDLRFNEINKAMTNHAYDYCYETNS